MNNFKNLTLSIAFISLMAIVFFSCDSNEENQNDLSNLNSKLIELEKASESKHVDNDVYTLSQINNGINIYNDFGIEVVSSFFLIRKQIEVLKIDKTSKKEDLISFTNNLSDKIFPDEITLNTTERKIYNSFINNIDQSNLIFKVLEYEKFIYSNYENKSKFKNLFIVFSIIKQVKFHQTNSQMALRCPGFNCWEICVDQCMDNIYSNMNTIDWVRWVATNPAANVLWDYSSCAWDCY